MKTGPFASRLYFSFLFLFLLFDFMEDKFIVGSLLYFLLVVVVVLWSQQNMIREGKRKNGKMPINKREGQNSIFFFFFFYRTSKNIWKSEGVSLYRVGWRIQCQRFDFQSVFLIQCLILIKYYEPRKVYLHTDSVIVFHLFSALWNSYSIFPLWAWLGPDLFLSKPAHLLHFHSAVDDW